MSLVWYGARMLASFASGVAIGSAAVAWGIARSPWGRSGSR
jgi:hypothetical protein